MGLSPVFSYKECAMMLFLEYLNNTFVEISIPTHSFQGRLSKS